MIVLDQYRAGHYERTGGYQFFVPSEINDEWVWQNSEINALLEKAAVHLGELNSFSKLVPNIDLFIRMHVTKEAVVSSRIEGTQTNIGEAFLPEAEIPSERGA
jgi:Fic family protein